MGISIDLHAYLYPLQTYKMSDFWKAKGSDSTGALFFLIGIAVVITILIIINVVKKKYNVPSLTGAAPQQPSANSAPRRFSGLALHRLASNMGLNQGQTKMLDFVFKTDGVADPQQSINNPTLLDQHFRRAYRVIERGSNTDAEAQERLSVLFSTRNMLEAGSGGGNINSTRQVPDNTSAVLGVGGESYPVRVLSTKGEHMTVESPKNSLGTTVHVSQGGKATLSFFTKSSKGFSFESRIMGITESKNGPVLQMAHSSQIKRLSQRRFRRRQAAIAASFYLVYVENQKMVVDKRRLTGNIQDISVGGCSIKTNAPVKSGARLKIECTVGDNTSAAVLGQVLRTNRSGASTIMHVKFLKVPRKSLNAINAFVYDYIE